MLAPHVWPAVAVWPAAFLSASPVAPKSRRIDRRRLPAHRPHFEFPVCNYQDGDDDKPSDQPCAGNSATEQAAGRRRCRVCPSLA